VQVRVNTKLVYNQQKFNLLREVRTRAGWLSCGMT
jgi:hypothetical protein